MNSLDYQFKTLLQNFINSCYESDYSDLTSPSITDPHAIGLLRGRILTMKEVYEECDNIMKKLTEPEKILEKK